MEIESYDLCHIGIKLKSFVDLNVLKDKIKKILSARGYELVDKTLIDSERRVIKVIICAKENISIELNYMANALNIVGTELINVSNIFNEVVSILPDIGYDTTATVVFYEILANLNIKSYKNPLDILTYSSRIDLKSLGDIKDVGITGVSISNKDQASEHEIFSLIIEPSPNSPRDRFAIRLQYRSKDTKEILAFQKSLEGRITRIIESFGGENHES